MAFLSFSGVVVACFFLVTFTKSIPPPGEQYVAVGFADLGDVENAAGDVESEVPSETVEEVVQPEIAPNTGAIIRLCANTGATLHLVEPLGFELGDRLLRRGGLDYHEYADMHVHADLDAVAATLTGRWFGFSARSTRRYTDIAYEDDDVLVFGTERAGLTPEQKERFPAEQLLTIPMLAGNRSMNLANAVSVVVYEAWRQADFAGAGADQPGLTSETTATAPFDS